MIRISPGVLEGAVTVPSSKSLSIRALVANYMTGGRSILHNLSEGEDALAAHVLTSQMHVRLPFASTLTSAPGALSSSLLPTFDCGESALTLHLAAPAAALQAERVLFTGRGSLLHRPLKPLTDALTAFGVKCQGLSGQPHASGVLLEVQGPLQAGKKVLDGSYGSQAVSGLLMALPLLERDSEIILLHPVSRPYIELTLSVMKQFGLCVDVEVIPQAHGFRYQIPGRQSYCPTAFTVGGDWSAAAALMAAAAVSSLCYKSSGVIVKGLGEVDTAMPDSVLIEVLRAAGVSCIRRVDGWKILVENSVQPFSFDLTQAPDLAPALTALAAYAPGVSVLKGAGRLRTKESNRGEALQQVFGGLGVRIDLSDDELAIYGGSVRGSLSAEQPAESFSDHRIAMAAGIAAVGAEKPVFLSGASCVAKTYPRFWDDMAALGLRIQKIP